MITINFLCCLIAIISLLNVTIILVLSTWGWFNWYEARKPSWLKWVKPCIFCFGFRLAVVEIVILAIFIPSWGLVIVPFCCASLTFIIVSK